jgi:hypothetical protein
MPRYQDDYDDYIGDSRSSDWYQPIRYPDITVMNMPSFRSFERAQGLSVRGFDMDYGDDIDDLDDMEDTGPGSDGRWRGFAARSTRWSSMNPGGFSTGGWQTCAYGPSSISVWRTVLSKVVLCYSNTDRRHVLDVDLCGHFLDA